MTVYVDASALVALHTETAQARVVRATTLVLRALLKNFALPSVRRAVVWTDAPATDEKRQTFEEALRKALGARPVEIREG